MDAAMDITLKCFLPQTFAESLSTENLMIHLKMIKDLELIGNTKCTGIQEVIGQVHTCLNSSKARIQGLLVLSAIIDQCNTDIFTQHSFTWFKFILQIYQSRGPPLVHKLASHVCCQLLKTSSVFTTMNKSIGNTIAELFPLLLAAPKEWRRDALGVMSACMMNYRGICGPYKGKVESFVCKELMIADVSEEAVICYTLLASCGSSGNQKIKYTEGWTAQFTKLLNGLNYITGHLYDGLNLEFLPQTDSCPFDLGVLPESCADKLCFLFSRFQTLMRCLKNLLSQTFPAVVKLPVEQILQLVDNVLSVTCSKLRSHPSTDRLLLSGFIPALHTECVTLLQVLTESTKKLLLPYSKRILSALTRELLWTHVEVAYGQAKPYSELREAVYQMLITWFKCTGSFVEAFREEENLLGELLFDSQIETDVLKLNQSKLKTSNISSEPPPPKKKKSGGYQELSHGISTQRKLNTGRNCSLTATTLEALYWWMFTSGIKFKSKTYQKITQFCIRTSLTVYQNKFSLGVPYSDTHCRLGLVKVMKACVMTPHKDGSSPLQCAICVFRLASQDESLEVSTFCQEALRICEILIHPRMPCFHKPKYVEEESAVHTSGSLQQNSTRKRTLLQMSEIEDSAEENNFNNSYEIQQSSDMEVDGRGDEHARVSIQSSVSDKQKSAKRKKKADDRLENTRNETDDDKFDSDYQNIGSVGSKQDTIGTNIQSDVSTCLIVSEDNKNSSQTQRDKSSESEINSEENGAHLSERFIDTSLGGKQIEKISVNSPSESEICLDTTDSEAQICLDTTDSEAQICLDTELNVENKGNRDNFLKVSDDIEMDEAGPSNSTGTKWISPNKTGNIDTAIENEDERLHLSESGGNEDSRDKEDKIKSEEISEMLQTFVDTDPE